MFALILLLCDIKAQTITNMSFIIIKSRFSDHQSSWGNTLVSWIYLTDGKSETFLRHCEENKQKMTWITWFELIWELLIQTNCDYTLHAHTRGIPIVVALTVVNHTLSSVGEAETDREVKSESVKMVVWNNNGIIIMEDNDTL